MIEGITGVILNKPLSVLGFDDLITLGIVADRKFIEPCNNRWVTRTLTLDDSQSVLVSATLHCLGGSRVYTRVIPSSAIVIARWARTQGVFTGYASSDGSQETKVSYFSTCVPVVIGNRDYSPRKYFWCEKAYLLESGAIAVNGSIIPHNNVGEVVLSKHYEEARSLVLKMKEVGKTVYTSVDDIIRIASTIIANGHDAIIKWLSYYFKPNEIAALGLA